MLAAMPYVRVFIYVMHSFYWDKIRTGRHYIQQVQRLNLLHGSRTAAAPCRSAASTRALQEENYIYASPESETRVVSLAAAPGFTV